MSLTFVVGTGRCGSTAVSRVLGEHPDVLSISEMLVGIKQMLRPGLSSVDGREIWRLLAQRAPILDEFICAGLKTAELCYPYDSGRFDPARGEVPWICHSMLPMLSDDPDALFDLLAAEVGSWPARPPADQFRALFAFLSELFGKSVVVERSGISIDAVPQLRQQFPEARFVLIHRDGPNCALSMSRHPLFRLRGLWEEVRRLQGEAPDNRETSPGQFRPAVRLRGTEEEVKRLHGKGPVSRETVPEQFRGLITPPFDAARFMSYPIPLTVFGELWSTLLCQGVPDLAELPPGGWTTLRYEDLVSHPARELARIAAFIGVAATSQWLSAAAAIINGHRPASAATSELGPADLAAIREACIPGAQAIVAAEARLAAAARESSVGGDSV